MGFNYIKYSDDDTDPEMTQAIDSIDLKIEAGQFIAVLGHNGSGKSTLAKHINALLQPTSGTMHYYYPLDAGKMNEAAAFLVGEHDFASFCASGFSGKTTVRTIYRADVRREDDLIIFTIVGNGFLYNMVRIISGTLIQVGSGEIQPGEMKQILEARDRSAAGPTAIPKGLVLKKIEYPEAEE